MSRDEVHALLHRSSRLMLAVDLACISVRAMCVLLAALLLASAVDAVLGLRPWGLIALDVLLIAVAATGLVYVLALLPRGRHHARRAAVMVEQRLGIADSLLINAVDLAMPGSGGPGVSTVLRDRAVTMGEQLAGTLSPGEVVDRRALIGAGKAAGIAMLVLAVAYTLMPGVFHAVLPRLLAPMADHPPFTLVQFDVTVAPQPVIYGQPASIRVRLSGPALPDRASVVFDAAPTAERRRVAMLRTVGAKAQTESDSATATPSSYDIADAHFLLRLDQAQRTGRFFVDTPQGRSRWYDLRVLPVPLFERVTIDYAYPSYTGWVGREEPLGPAGIRSLAGTLVTLSVDSNVALARGTLALDLTTDDGAATASVVTLEPDSAANRTARGTFSLLAGGTYTLTLTGGDGMPSSETLGGDVVCVPDTPPEVAIVEPPARVIAPEGWWVDVSIVARDDVGVSRLVLHRGVNGWGPVPVDLELTGTDSTHVAADYRFDLADLGARAGDVITYFATAFDNLPAGPQVGQTAVYAIQVISEEDYLAYARTQYRMEELVEEFAAFEGALEDLKQQREEILKELQALQDQLARGEPLTDEQRQRIRDLEARLADYAVQANDLAEQMRERAAEPSLYNFEQAYQEMLSQTADALTGQNVDAAAVAEALEQLNADDSAEQRSGLGARALRFKENDEPFGQVEQAQRDEVEADLEKYRLADAIIAQAERIRAIVEEQQGLADRLASLRDRNRFDMAEQRVADLLAAKQALLRQELHEAQAGLRTAAEEAVEVLPGMSGDAMDICDAIDDLQIESDQRDAERLAGAGDGAGAHQAAQSAADKLDSLLIDTCAKTGEGELADSLQLPRMSVIESLKQLAQGRTLPGLGQQGGTGVGMQGSMAQMAVMGPAVRAAGSESAASQGLTRGAGRGGAGAAGSGDGAESWEELTPSRTTGRGQGATAMPGVPGRFREEAEAYFRRLATDGQ